MIVLPTWKRALAVVAGAALAISLTACGGGSAKGSGGTPTVEAEPGAFPVSIKHKYGSTKLTEAPSRVVSVGLNDQDSLLAMGVVPVGVTKWFGEAPGFIFPWAEEALGDGKLPTVLTDADGIQVEKIIKLKPDLIIGTYSAMTEKEYQELSKVAPTVAQNGDHPDFATPWDESAQVIGQAVGKPKEMAELIDDVQGQIDQVAADHPQWKGQSAVVVTPYEGLFVYGKDDPRARLLSDLGLTFPKQFESDKSVEFGESLSPERTSDLEGVDLVVWFDLAAVKSIKKVFDQTDTAAQGRWIDVDEADGDYYVAQSYITPLSIPYLLKRYVPQLEAAIDGDPATEVPAVKN